MAHQHDRIVTMITFFVFCFLGGYVVSRWPGEVKQVLLIAMLWGAIYWAARTAVREWKGEI